MTDQVDVLLASFSTSGRHGRPAILSSSRGDAGHTLDETQYLRDLAAFSEANCVIYRDNN
jgi:hypothetical protein